MARTQPETRIVNHIRQALHVEGAKTVKLHGSALMLNEPDIVGVLEGVPFAIEVKQPGEKPRLGQVLCMLDWRKAGTKVGIAENEQDAWDIINTGTNRHEHYLTDIN